MDIGNNGKTCIGTKWWLRPCRDEIGTLQLGFMLNAGVEWPTRRCIGGHVQDVELLGLVWGTHSFWYESQFQPSESRPATSDNELTMWSGAN